MAVLEFIVLRDYKKGTPKERLIISPNKVYKRPSFKIVGILSLCSLIADKETSDHGNRVLFHKFLSTLEAIAASLGLSLSLKARSLLILSRIF